MLRSPQLACILVVTTILLGCGPSFTSTDAPPASSDTPPTVLVVNYPLYFFASWIAGDAANVEFPAPEGVDPDYWRPSSEVIEQFQQADLILVNGASFGRWLDRVTLPESRIHNTSEAFRDQYIMLPDAIVHRHGPDGEHTHEGLASHTWLSPAFARRQANSVREALTQLVPKKSEYFRQQWVALDRELGNLEDELRRLSELHPGLRMYASHPLYDYLAQFCGWEVKNYHWEPDETPTDRQWEAFAKQHPQFEARVMIWEDRPSEETEQRLRDEFQVSCVPLATLSNRPAEGDYLSIMKANLARLEQVLEAAQ
jgi:zinc transport system substrate-binding protein